MIYVNDSSRVWHVAKVGNDSNSGHAGQYPVNLANDAKLTIGAAVSAAASGDTIIIWPGDYAENVNAGSKALTFAGTNRAKSHIVPATGAALTLADGCIVKNLSCEALQVAAQVAGIYAFQKKNIVIEDCDISGAYDGLYLFTTTDVYIRNCRVFGKYDSANFNTVTGLMVENCVFRADGTYGTSVNCRAAWGNGEAIFRKCQFIAGRSDASSMTLAGYYIGSASARHIFDDCIFVANGGPSFTGSIYAFQSNYASGNVIMNGCVFYTSSTGTPSEMVDLKNSAGAVVVNGCRYASSGGIITQSDSNWASALAVALFTNGAANKLTIDAAGRVTAESLQGVNAESIQKAAKMLLNKAAQDKLTGAIRYYDDDGQTVILTHTPQESESSLTRTVN